VKDGFVCSLCCGENRRKETCHACIYYQDSSSKRKYDDIPMFNPQVIANHDDLIKHSMVIEGTLCAFDLMEKTSDSTILKILEKLLDDYYFHEDFHKIQNQDEAASKGYLQVKFAIEKNLSHVPAETIVKLIHGIYYVAKRRSMGNREYLDFIHQFIGKKIMLGLYR
jgi:hypothetical protein